MESSSHLAGNEAIKSGDFDVSIVLYSAALSEYGGLQGQDTLWLKALSNRGYCHLKQRNYCNAIDDFNILVNTIQSKPICDQQPCSELGKLLTKSLIRRAMCYEYMVEFNRAMRDVSTALARNNALLQDDSVKCLLSRLRASMKSDGAAASKEPRPAYLVSAAQSLRLAFLCEPPTNVSIGDPFYCKLCLGNEFGLFDRRFYMKGEGSAGATITISLDESREPAHSADYSVQSHNAGDVLGRIGCELLVLDGEGVQLARSGGEGMPLLWDIGPDGKALLDLKFVELSPRVTETMIILRFFVSEHRLHSGLDNNIMSVLSLPVLLHCGHAQHSIGQFCGGMQVRMAADALQASCVRSLELVDSEPVYVLESAGLLGIGGKIWDSTFAITRYLQAHQKEFISGKNILELGSGTGITGLFLAQFLPKRVIMTDLPQVVPLLQGNILLNQCLKKGTPAALVLQQSFHAADYSWGEDLPDALLDCSWDTVIASDVVYSPECYRPLYESLSMLLKRSPCHARCILSHRHRHPEDNQFFDMLAADPLLQLTELDWTRDCGPGTLQGVVDIRMFSICAVMT